MHDISALKILILHFFYKIGSVIKKIYLQYVQESTQMRENARGKLKATVFIFTFIKNLC